MCVCVSEREFCILDYQPHSPSQHVPTSIPPSLTHTHTSPLSPPHTQANELDLAIDVYQQMLAEGCTPNVVTYNTLIDVYGKTGQWQEAIAVLDTLEQQV